MVKMRKAVVFTLTLLIMGSLVISLALVVRTVQQNNSERTVNIAVLDRVHQLSYSIREAVVDIVKVEQVVNVKKNGNKVIINHTVGENLGENFKQALVDFQEFIVNDSHADMNLDGLENFQMIIIPQNISFDFDGKKDEKIKLSPGAINYSITISTTKKVSECKWDVDPGTFPLRVIVFDKDGVACDDTQNVDPYGDNEIDIKGSNYKIKLKNEELEIKVKEDKDATADVEIVIGLDREADDVILGNALINVNFSEFNISRAAPVSLLWN